MKQLSLFLVIVAVAQGCGGDDPAPGAGAGAVAGTTAGSFAGTTAGTAAGSTAGTTAGATAGGGGAAGTFPQAGTAADGGTPDGGDPGPDSSVPCEPYRLILQGGSLTGSHAVTQLRLRSGPSLWQIGVRGDAMLALYGDTPAARPGDEFVHRAFDQGTALEVKVAQIYTASAPDAIGTVQCAGAGSKLWVHPEGQALDLLMVGALQDCAAAPSVAGQLTGCFGGLQDCRDLDGALESATIDTSVWLGDSSNESFDAHYEDGTLIRFWRDGWGGASSTGTIKFAFIFTPPDGPNAGAVYCSTTGSTWNDDTSSFTLTNLRKPGTCAAPAGSDHVLGCLREH
jgi:hypothetical protein